MQLRTASSAVFAGLLGIAQCYVIIYGWMYIGAYSPIAHWLLEAGLRGRPFYAISGASDFLLSVLLALPLAVILVRLRPFNLWLYVMLAVAVAFVWLRVELTDSLFGGLVLQLLAVLVAVWSVAKWHNRPSSNNSFKPKPLRGSA